MFKEGVTSDTGEKLKTLAVWYSKRVQKHLFLVIAITLLCVSPHCLTMLIICPLQPTPSVWSLLYLQLGFLHPLPFSVQSISVHSLLMNLSSFFSSLLMVLIVWISMPISYSLPRPSSDLLPVRTSVWWVSGRRSIHRHYHDLTLCLIVPYFSAFVL